MKPRRLEIEPLEKARWDRIARDLRERLEREPLQTESSESRVQTTLRSPRPSPSSSASSPPKNPSSIASAPSTTASAGVVQTPSPRERYDRALTLEATRPDEALSIYRDLGSGEGSWAMNALFAEARLELERGNKDAARKHFAEYLQRYPTGPNAHDASELSAKLQ